MKNSEPDGTANLELEVDAKRWEQAKEACRCLTGREVTDEECLLIIVEHCLRKHEK